MKKRVDKPIETLMDVVEDIKESNPVRELDTDTLHILAREIHAQALQAGYSPKAIVCKRDSIITNPLNWGIVLCLSPLPVSGMVVPVGVRWGWNGEGKNLYSSHHPVELKLIHKAISESTLKAIEAIDTEEYLV